MKFWLLGNVWKSTNNIVVDETPLPNVNITITISDHYFLHWKVDLGIFLWVKKYVHQIFKSKFQCTRMQFFTRIYVGENQRFSSSFSTLHTGVSIRYYISYTVKVLEMNGQRIIYKGFLPLLCTTIWWWGLIRMLEFHLITLMI